MATQNDLDFNPITFTEFIRDLETYLRECVSDAGDDADIVAIGEDIGRLLAGQQAISLVIANEDFWGNYQTWKTEDFNTEND